MTDFMSILMPLLLPLVVYGIPIGLGVRWLIRQRLRSESTLAALPTREQFETMTERLETLAGRLEAMDERQLFLERLLKPPAKAEAGHVVATNAGADSA